MVSSTSKLKLALYRTPAPDPSSKNTLFSFLAVQYFRWSKFEHKIELGESGHHEGALKGTNS